MLLAADLVCNIMQLCITQSYYENQKIHRED